MARFERTIEDGRKQAQSVLERLDAEVPKDRLVPSKQVEFVPLGDGVELMLGDAKQGIHDHAFGQLCQAVDLHRAWAKRLRDWSVGNGDADWARELLAETLRKLFKHGPAKDKRFFVRSVDDQIRGWLSDRYRVLDCRPLIQAFHKHAIVNAGAVPVRAYSLDTKVAIRVVMPEVFEPIEGIPCMYGLEWHNSDFGHGAHSLRSFIHMPWCTNEATRDDVLKQVHIGKRLSDDFDFSMRTRQLDQKTAVAALGDFCKGLLGPAKIAESMEVLRTAHEKKCDDKTARRIVSTTLTKGEADKVVELFNSTDDINMPPGENRLRLSNAISFLANNTKDRYRALTMERLAGRVSGLAKDRDED